MKSKAGPPAEAQAEQQHRITFCFTQIESELLDKISGKLFRTKAERRMAFVLLGRWCLSNWHKLEPSFLAEIAYAQAEGVKLFDLSEAKIAIQSKLYGRKKP